MKISNIKVKNYRNLRNVKIDTNNVVVFIGDNNSGKSNLLRAITLPFINHEIGAFNKNLGWQDLNNDARQEYYSFIESNLDKIRGDECELDDFRSYIPSVSVEVSFTPQALSEEYYVRNWTNNLEANPLPFLLDMNSKLKNLKIYLIISQAYYRM
ncbi:AAA family ATPase [Halobacillus amylolyticus]|uniref:AAA family ATPase n=1 Tax=Halobacillus amylolyticus TaxID=2932259 RepID=A0ABY4H9M3_9BACI|nr:AAA family ATPase [Halobacillus amylolyticus]UOR10983.1 AAA family ATPase [Halobacillus amylolyticus]